MTRREQLQENVEDAVFALLMEDVAEQEGKRLIEENEQLKHDPSAKVPDDLDKRCRKIIKRSYAKDRRRTVGRTIHNILGNVALAAMVCILLFVSAFAAVPEIRVMTLNLLIEVSDVSTSLRLVGADNEPVTQDGKPDDADSVQTLWGYRLPEIPGGYVLDYENSSERAVNLWYSNAEGNFIRFNIAKAHDTFSLNVDTESAEVEDIKVHGYDGLLIGKEEVLKIVWGDTDQKNFVSITCLGVDQNILLNFANEMEYCGNE